MKKLWVLFFICGFLFLLNEGLDYLEYDLPVFWNHYLNDLLAMPIVLMLCLILTRLIHKNKSIRLSLFTTCSVAALYAVYFELYLPGRSARYTADLLDALLYFCGALLFYFLQPECGGESELSEIKHE